MGGWKPLVEILKEAAEAEGAQVSWKEKFGTLRISPYGSHGLYRLATALEHLSSMTCQFCCRPGRTRQRLKGGWIRTLCDEHDRAINQGHDWVSLLREAESRPITLFGTVEREAFLAILRGPSPVAANFLREHLVSTYGPGPYPEHSMPSHLENFCAELEQPLPKI